MAYLLEINFKSGNLEFHVGECLGLSPNVLRKRIKFQNAYVVRSPEVRLSQKISDAFNFQRIAHN